VGSDPYPLSFGVFLPLPLLQTFPLLVAGCVLLLLPSQAGLFIYSSGRIPLPHFGTQGTPPSLLCVFFVVIAYSVFFSFYPGWGRSVQIWPRVFCGSTACHLAHLVVCVFPSRLGAAVWWRRGSPAGSPFNVKWRCYAQARGAEESKFCLFSVVFPVRCISSLSPGFYFRRHAFCFLPLATILESPQVW
jgi:hypothetical protein